MRQKLEALRTDVETAAGEYDAKATAGQLHSMPQSGQCGSVPAKELLKTYNSRMAHPEAPGRHIYDELFIVPQRRCPLCGQRDVSTLDHYLPESKYSLLVVTPANLVPVCKDCNFKKRAVFPTSAETQTIHPYYDDFNDATWVRAKLIDANPLGVIFEAIYPHGWNQTKYARARYHFETLELGDLYSDHAVGELVEIKHRIADLYEAGGKQAVSDDLAVTASSITSVYRNSWRGALYVAAANTDWFCDGGFARIAE
jgi:5-methylcytosine-specific restriction endonuclease McrA